MTSISSRIAFDEAVAEIADLKRQLEVLRGALKDILDVVEPPAGIEYWTRFEQMREYARVALRNDPGPT